MVREVPLFSNEH